MTARKVAILGGGAAALTAAFELTRPEHAGQYDVTVYQMGWRLGGKGASGRNRDACNRIEEHGLHIWMGFYDKAFGVMKDAYGELNRTTGPLQKWSDAFKPHSFIALEELFDGAWTPCWELDFPINGLTPGPGPAPTIWDMVKEIVAWMEQRWSQSPHGQTAPTFAAAPVPQHIEDAVGSAISRGPARAASLPDLSEIRTPGLASLLARARAIVFSAFADSAPARLEVEAVIWLIREMMKAAWGLLEAHVATDVAAFQLWVSINLAGSAVCGILDDDIVTKGWLSIDDQELRAWLGKHGANDVTLGAAPLRAVYDLVFGYADGDVSKPQFAAGTAMYGMLRMLLTYKGAIFYKMQAGMGDTVFTPLYQVLKKRGVKFQFFHRVDDLVVDPETKRVREIQITQQVKLEASDYDPLVNVLDLPCWPSKPKYELITNGSALEASGINLESAWAKPWQDETKKTLSLGTHFDLVVLGISIGAFPYMARQLSTNSRAFAAMVENVKTVQTCAFQLWMNVDLAALGWRNPAGVTEPPVMGAFVEPLDTWADMTHLLPRETWPTASKPLQLSYFCGVFRQDGPLPPFTDEGFPARQLALLRSQVDTFLDQSLVSLWPNAVQAGQFRWDWLDDLTEGETGEARLGSQYLRVNIDPSERYVLSVPGSTRYRLSANEAGFPNLYLAGDWTLCEINAGCVEAAVSSGLLAAQAIIGGPRARQRDSEGAATASTPPPPPT